MSIFSLKLEIIKSIIDGFKIKENLQVVAYKLEYKSRTIAMEK